ncbi:MAG: hypothetical protein WAN51_01205 [Alphaproteobacteria bacterium]
MADRAPPSKKPRTEQRRIQIHYLKSNQFRVIAGEGIIGSASPQGKLFCVLFSERLAIPRSMTHEVFKGELVRRPVETETRGGIVRELEVGVVMDLAVAARVRDWLTETINKTNEALKKAKKVRKGNGNA